MNKVYKTGLFIKKLVFNGLSLRNCSRIMSFLWRRIVLRQPVPVAVLLGLTYECMCKCVHCYASGYVRRSDELSTAQLKEIIDYCDKWGVLKVTYFGGEPLLREDLIELVAYATEKGIKSSIDTNGYLLTEETVLALKQAGLEYVNVSIDSVRADIHDELRGKPGCFEAAVNGLRACVQHGLSCQISIYASHRSIKDQDIAQIKAFAQEIGVTSVKVMEPKLLGRWRGKDEECLTEAEKQHVAEQIDHSFVIKDPPIVFRTNVLKMIQNKGEGCSAKEWNFIYIAPDGEVQPCPVIPVTFGNIKKRPLGDIVKDMLGHPFYREYLVDDGVCLPNREDFRSLVEQYDDLPVPVERLWRDGALVKEGSV